MQQFSSCISQQTMFTQILSIVFIGNIRSSQFHLFITLFTFNLSDTVLASSDFYIFQSFRYCITDIAYLIRFLSVSTFFFLMRFSTAIVILLCSTSSSVHFRLLRIYPLIACSPSARPLRPFKVFWVVILFYSPQGFSPLSSLPIDFGPLFLRGILYKIAYCLLHAHLILCIFLSI